MDESIYISNSGLVLLNAYFPNLFGVLGLTTGQEFISVESQLKASKCLQYLVTGHTDNDNNQLVLNKILCGLSLEIYVPNDISISSAEKEHMDELITAAIRNWPLIKGLSAEGFRRNWLAREGLLKEESNGSKLHVARTTYDVLLDKYPVSFSIIKQPWMSKLLIVDWY